MSKRTHKSSLSFAAFVLTAFAFLMACGTGSSQTTNTNSDEAVTPLVETTTIAPAPTTPPSNVLFTFTDPQSVQGWSSVDDSVMGGISSSTTTWIDSGSLLFSGTMTTESNGGFTSTLGPADRGLGAKAAGTAALAIDAIGDGRTYVARLRAGTDGRDRWIARFTPLSTSDRTGGNVSVIPFDSFEPVDRFLRPTTPSGRLDPATILQIGVYLIDGQVGQFRLAIRSFVAQP